MTERSAFSRWMTVFATLLISLVALGVEAQIVIYDDALQNGWENWSYNGGSDFANPTPVRSGAASIAFTPAPDNGASMARPAGELSIAAYGRLNFWIHGGAASGQQLQIILQGDGGSNLKASGSLTPFISGGGIAAGQWREVIVNLAALTAVGGWDGFYDRIDIVSGAGAQATVYMDDFTLLPPAADAGTMLIERNVTVTDMISDRFTWNDSSAKPRTAVLAHSAIPASYPESGPIYGGMLREFRYRLSNDATRVVGVTTYGFAGYGGFGYVVSHASRSISCVGDDSPLGNYTPIGRFYRVFEGRHHAIFRFKQYYPRNCTTTSPVAAHRMPVTIDWVFATGRDYPLWAVTYDVDGTFRVSDGAIAPANTFYDDSRAPYGELNIDGEGFTVLDGVAWGDRYRFTSTGATPVTINSPWSWVTANTVPYVKVWLNGPLTASNTRDAEMGIVQTQTNAQQDAGGGRDPGIGSDIRPMWGQTSATFGTGCPSGGYLFPCANDWPYQAIANSLEFAGAGGTNNARMTWKTQYGFLGQTAYALNDGTGGTAPGYPKKSYSTHIVLGQASAFAPNGPTATQRMQVEAIQSMVLSATTGSVVTSGPAGNVRTDNVTYAPAGYNHVYGALAFNASGAMLDANINAPVTLTKPLVIVGNYSSALPTVRFANVTLVADVDYFASLRPDKNEVWITLNRNVTGAANRLEVIGSCAAVSITSPDSAAPGSVVTASISPRAGSTYAWTVTGGTITAGADTAVVTFTAGSAGTRMTVSVVETTATCGTVSASKRVMSDFLDVSPSHPFYSFITKLARNGITTGCGEGNYCPNAEVLRSQMAIFLLRGKHGESYVPPPATGIFADAPPGSFAADFIEQLFHERVTTGCAATPPQFCPNSPVLRSQMAIFLMVSKHGRGYVAPPPVGIFGDVPPGSFAANWIEKLYNEGVTGGCSGPPLMYCPNASTTRGQMAVFLTRTFNLQ